MYGKYYFPIFHPQVHKIINNKVKLRISFIFRFSDRRKLPNKSGFRWDLFDRAIGPVSS